MHAAPAFDGASFTALCILSSWVCWNSFYRSRFLSTRSGLQYVCICRPCHQNGGEQFSSELGSLSPFECGSRLSGYRLPLPGLDPMIPFSSRSLFCGFFRIARNIGRRSSLTVWYPAPPVRFRKYELKRNRSLCTTPFVDNGIFSSVTFQA